MTSHNLLRKLSDNPFGVVAVVHMTIGICYGFLLNGKMMVFGFTLSIFFVCAHYTSTRQ